MFTGRKWSNVLSRLSRVVGGVIFFFHTPFVVVVVGGGGVMRVALGGRCERTKKPRTCHSSLLSRPRAPRPICCSACATTRRAAAWARTRPPRPRPRRPPRPARAPARSRWRVVVVVTSLPFLFCVCFVVDVCPASGISFGGSNRRGVILPASPTRGSRALPRAQRRFAHAGASDRSLCSGNETRDPDVTHCHLYRCACSWSTSDRRLLCSG